MDYIADLDIVDEDDRRKNNGLSSPFSIVHNPIDSNLGMHLYAHTRKGSRTASRRTFLIFDGILGVFAFFTKFFTATMK